MKRFAKGRPVSVETYDLGVIGGGPAGMVAAIAAGQKKREERGVKTKVEKGQRVFPETWNQKLFPIFTLAAK